MAERVRQVALPATDGVYGLVVVLMVLCLLSVLTGARQTQASEGVWVQVRGEVRSPGLYRVYPATRAAAVEAAGGPVRVQDEREIHEGDVLEVTPDAILVAPSERASLWLVSVDVNHASAEAIAGLPGIGPALAQAIVASRDADGPFPDAASLARVRGISEDRAAQWASFWTGFASDALRPLPSQAEPGAGRTSRHSSRTRAGKPALRGVIDLNHASLSDLQRLPGIGPAIAQRIVDDRSQNGLYTHVSQIERVKGIGPATRIRLSPWAAVNP